MYKRFNVFLVAIPLLFLASSSFAQDLWTGGSNLSSSQVLKLQKTFRSQAETLACWDFESGWDDWWVDNGVWEIGTPATSAPCSVVAHSRDSCAGTNLDGLYPNYSDTRLVSPAVNLPSIGVDEALRLSFWHWFSFDRTHHAPWGVPHWHVDSGRVEIQVYDYDSLSWGSWTKIGSIHTDSSVDWSKVDIEVSSYAGKRVRFGFRLFADGEFNSCGWYVDDVSVEYVSTEVEDQNDQQNTVFGDFLLRQNYPNPFNPQTKIEYTLPKETLVEIVIYNLLSQRVKTLIDERQTAGHKEILWDGRDDKGNDVASGIYFYQLKAGDLTEIKKMILLK